MSNFPSSLRIEANSNGNDWIIPDVHGCSRTLKNLINSLDLNPADRLFFLGDLVNKGPRSFEVLDYLMKMEEEGHRIIKVMGNHDLIWLDLLSGKISPDNPKIVCRDPLEWDRARSESYSDFIRRSYYFIEMGGFLLVHAGFNFDAGKPFSDFDSMTNIRAFEPRDRILKGRIVIHGHIAHPFEQIDSAIKLKLQKIPLDNGCVYFKTREGMGKLLALNAGTFEIKFVHNSDV